VNQIVSGNLKVDIVDGTTEQHLEKLSFQNKENSDDILWEPGVTFLTQGFKIKNDGNLALKWKMTVNKENAKNGKASDDAKDGKSLLDVIDFSVVTSTAENAEAVKIEDFVGHLTKETTSDETYYIKGHMQEEAGNDYQNLTLEDITITVYATQDTVEYDSFDDQYDKDAPLDFVSVSSQTELQNAINAAAPGKDVNISLEGDVTIEDTLYVIGKEVGTKVGDVTIQANGKTFTSTKEKGTRCLRIEYTNVEREITIIGAKVVSEGTQAGYNADENRGLALYGVKGATINLVNCEIKMEATNYSYAVKMINCENVTLNLTGCTLTGANCIETNGGSGNTVNITNCTLVSNMVGTENNWGNGINDYNGDTNTFNLKNTTFVGGDYTQPVRTNGTTVVNNLGGNVNKMANQQQPDYFD